MSLNTFFKRVIISDKYHTNPNIVQIFWQHCFSRMKLGFFFILSNNCPILTVFPNVSHVFEKCPFCIKILKSPFSIKTLKSPFFYKKHKNAHFSKKNGNVLEKNFKGKKFSKAIFSFLIGFDYLFLPNFQWWLFKFFRGCCDIVIVFTWTGGSLFLIVFFFTNFFFLN